MRNDYLEWLAVILLILFGHPIAALFLVLLIL